MSEYESSTQLTSTLSGLSESTSSTMLMVFTIFSYKKKERKESVSKAHTMLIINHQKANKIIRFRSFFVFGILSTKKWKDGGRNMKRKKEKRRIVILTDLNNVNSSSIKAKPTVW